MKNYFRVLIACFALGANSPSYANFSMSPSGSTTAFAIDAANQGTSLCAAASTECPATVPINTAGSPLFTSGTPGLVTLSGTNNIATVTTITTANLAAETTKNIGTIRVTGNIGGVLDAIGQNVAAPANWLQAGCQFQTAPTTITATNGSPLQCNNAAQLLASAAQNGTWTVQPGNTANTTPWLFSPSTGGNTAAVKAASTAPIATDPALVVAISPNSVNANGQTTASASAPVVLASNQSVADPCMFQAKTNLPISQNGTSSVQLVALSGATSIYVCSLSLVAAGATTVALTTGTGTACVTGNAAVIGSTTANIANSMSFATNGGLTLGNGGSMIAKGAASSELCMINGSNVFVSGNLTYVQQ